jgi:hypothetical protein
VFVKVFGEVRKGVIVVEVMFIFVVSYGGVLPV